MPVDQGRDLRDFATDAAELPWNQTINLPAGAFNAERESVDGVTQADPKPRAIATEVQPEVVTQTQSPPDIEATSDEEARIRRFVATDGIYRITHISQFGFLMYLINIQNS